MCKGPSRCPSDVPYAALELWLLWHWTSGPILIKGRIAHLEWPLSAMRSLQLGCEGKNPLAAQVL